MRRQVATERDFLRAGDNGDAGQRYYAGLVKAAEAAHDLAIDPAHKREADRIEKAGGRIKRVVLDHEFKSIAASRMNRVEGPHQLIGAQNWPPNWTCQSSKISWRCPIWGSNTRTPPVSTSTGISRS